MFFPLRSILTDGRPPPPGHSGPAAGAPRALVGSCRLGVGAQSPRGSVWGVLGPGERGPCSQSRGSQLRAVRRGVGARGGGVVLLLPRCRMGARPVSSEPTRVSAQALWARLSAGCGSWGVWVPGGGAATAAPPPGSEGRCPRGPVALGLGAGLGRARPPGVGAPRGSSVCGGQGAARLLVAAWAWGPAAACGGAALQPAALTLAPGDGASEAPVSLCWGAAWPQDGGLWLGVRGPVSVGGRLRALPPAGGARGG